MATDVGSSSRHTGLFGSQVQDNHDESEEIDFKMVTFTLAGKQYGIDIMMVKEIAKYGDFTYVPNTRPYVSGVYNLRGDIISVIDLRSLFSLPVPSKNPGEPLEGLILRLPDGLVGVVVDRIDRVVGIASETIQPPHPIFADVNIKYISGVVEHDERLYIVLDVERVLGLHEEFGFARNESGSSAPHSPPAPTGGVDPVSTTETSFTPGQPRASTPDERLIENLAQTLRALSGFTVSDLNREWVTLRASEWMSHHEGKLEITTASECDEFLKPFSSRRSHAFFDGQLLKAAEELFSRYGRRVNVWNPGCGQGQESYSLAVALERAIPGGQHKIWATDKDLLNVSVAPNLTITPGDTPAEFEEFLTQGVSGYSFNDKIRQMVLFEFSDILNNGTLAPCDVIFCRDVLSYMSREELSRAVDIFRETANPGARIVVGDNEDLAELVECHRVAENTLRVYEF